MRTTASNSACDGVTPSKYFPNLSKVKIGRYAREAQLEVVTRGKNLDIKRRTIILATAHFPAALAAGLATGALAATVVSELDPTAVSLGYKTDASKVDRVKFPKYAPPAACASCSLYQGKASDTKAPCTIFQGNLVAATGWCSAYTARA